MNWDLKNYIQYRVKNIFSFDPDLFIFLIGVLTAFLIFFSKFKISGKILIFTTAVVLIFILREYKIHKTGEHRRWARDRLGIPSPSEIQKLKEEANETKMPEVQEGNNSE